MPFVQHPISCTAILPCKCPVMSILWTCLVVWFSFELDTQLQFTIHQKLLLALSLWWSRHQQWWSVLIPCSLTHACTLKLWWFQYNGVILRTRSGPIYLHPSGCLWGQLIQVSASTHSQAMILNCCPGNMLQQCPSNTQSKVFCELIAFRKAGWHYTIKPVRSQFSQARCSHA